MKIAGNFSVTRDFFMLLLFCGNDNLQGLYMWDSTQLVRAM
jgi:hypothetical protein